jgi:hypothetical protein
VISIQIQLKFLAEEMQAISKGLEKVIQELSTSENDGPVSEKFVKLYTLFFFFFFNIDKIYRYLHIFFSNLEEFVVIDEVFKFISCCSDHMFT